MRTIATLIAAASLLLAMPNLIAAAETTGDHLSKYAGQENWIIKSLSPDDITELRSGSGWGLAKAAELNGVPGPAHLLEMKDKIPLTDDQVTIIDEIYKQMKKQAIQQGKRLIALEQDLELLFRSGTITKGALRSSLNKIAIARMELRFTSFSHPFENAQYFV